MHNCLPACMCVMGVPGALGVQKREIEHPGTVLTEDHEPLWMLGIKPKSLVRAISAFSTDPDLQPLNNYFQIIFSFF